MCALAEYVLHQLQGGVWPALVLLLHKPTPHTSTHPLPALPCLAVCAALNMNWAADGSTDFVTHQLQGGITLNTVSGQAAAGIGSDTTDTAAILAHGEQRSSSISSRSSNSSSDSLLPSSVGQFSASVVCLVLSWVAPGR